MTTLSPRFSNSLSLLYLLTFVTHNKMLSSVQRPVATSCSMSVSFRTSLTFLSHYRSLTYSIQYSERNCCVPIKTDTPLDFAIHALKTESALVKMNALLNDGITIHVICQFVYGPKSSFATVILVHHQSLN